MFALCEAIRTGFTDTQVQWTLFDNVNGVAGSSKRIFKAPATAIRPFYVEVSETGTVGCVRFRAWGDWDPATHTGAHGTADDGGATSAAQRGGIFAQDATFGYDLCFHDNGLVACSHTTFDSASFVGILDNASSVPSHMNGIAILQSDIIAGATSFPTQGMVNVLFPGQDLIIIGLTGNSGDARFGLKERVKITAVSASALTITATTNAYKAGSIAGFDPLPLGCTIQLNAAGQRVGIQGVDPPGAQGIFFPYRLDGSTSGTSDSSRVWSFTFDLSPASGSDLWGKTYRLGNLPVFQVGRLWGQNLGSVLGFEASRGRLPPTAGHFRTTTQALTDRIRVGADNWFRVISPAGAGGTGWADIGLAMGPRPGAEVANVGGVDWQGALALDFAALADVTGGLKRSFDNKHWLGPRSFFNNMAWHTRYQGPKKRTF